MSDELAELQHRYERLNLLYQVSNVIHSSLEPQEALGLILREAVRIMRGSSGSIVLINPNTGFLDIEASIGLPTNAAKVKLRVGEGITGWVARTGKAARISDVRKDSRYVMLGRDVRSELAVPLEVNGELRGVINVDSDQEDRFSESDQNLLQELSVQAAKVIHNTWLYQQLRLKAQLFETLVSVGQTINSTLNLGDALNVITREACALMNAKMCSLLMLDDSGEWLDLRASCGAGDVYINKARLRVEESFLGTVVRRHKPLQLDNVQASSRYQSVEVARREGLVALLSVPLIFSGEAIGALNVYKDCVYHFSNEEVRILAALAELSGLAIEKARLYERVVDVEEQLRQNEKLSALGLLAAEVAHEIRNPLTVMKMMFHSLDLNFPESDPRARDAQIMGEKMEHLNKIVEQILDFARNSEPKLVSLDVNQLIDDLGLLVRHKLRNQNINLVRKLSPGLPMICADATQLEQAFLNLTLNAVEAMPKGGTLTISTAVVQRGKTSEALQIEFKDTGEGMSDEQQEKLFRGILNTTKQKGTGLGLAIVQRVAEIHRGKLKIQSQPGKGTSISILLPCDLSEIG
ncbi:MAG: phospho-acceptor protein [Verrucomicrobiales bacterium]|nr:phospho-acceptor protein [Verrucomicrobiales bacterium]